MTGLLFVLGLPWGPVGIAAAWTTSIWILTIPAFWYAGKPISFGVAPVLGAIWRYVLASLLAGCANSAIIRIMPMAGASSLVEAMVRVSMISLLFGALYLSAVIILHGGLRPLHSFLRLLRDMIPWTPSPHESRGNS